VRDEAQQVETSSERTVVPESCILYGRVLFRQAWFQARLGLYERTEEQFQKSLWLLQRAGDSLRREVAFCLLLFGTSFTQRGEGVKAVSPLQEGRAIDNEIGDSWGSGLALLCLGQAVFALGQFEEAERLSQESITLSSQIGERRYIIYTISTLGRIAIVQGNYPQAERWHQECLKRRADLSDRVGLAFTLNDLGDTARLQGRLDQARQYYQQSLTLAKEIGLRQVQNQVLWKLGSLAERLGHYAEAKHLFQESSAAYEGKYVTTINPAGPGWAHLGLGEVQEAATYFRNALDLALHKQAAPLALDALTGTAYLLAQAGKLEQALELLTLVQYHQPAPKR
jgi:tetratricopeptide (TPR) repeat protein